MQLKYRGCSYTSSTTAQPVSANATLTYRGAKYQQNATTPQSAVPQYQPLMYRGAVYFAY